MRPTKVPMAMVLMLVACITMAAMVSCEEVEVVPQEGTEPAAAAEEASWWEVGAMGLLLGVIGWLLKELLFPAAPNPPVVVVPPRRREPVVMKDFTPEELRKMDGTQGNPIYVAVRGVVYDVSSRASFYGPGGPYHVFAGRDAARALALGSLDERDVESPYPRLDDLQPSEMEALNDWIASYQAKYEVVGRLIPPADGAGASSPSD